MSKLQKWIDEDGWPVWKESIDWQDNEPETARNPAADSPQLPSAIEPISTASEPVLAPRSAPLQEAPPVAEPLPPRPKPNAIQAIRDWARMQLSTLDWNDTRRQEDDR